MISGQNLTILAQPSKHLNKYNGYILKRRLTVTISYEVITVLTIQD